MRHSCCAAVRARPATAPPVRRCARAGRRSAAARGSCYPTGTAGPRPPAGPRCMSVPATAVHSRCMDHEQPGVAGRCAGEVCERGCTAGGQTRGVVMHARHTLESDPRPRSWSRVMASFRRRGDLRKKAGSTMSGQQHLDTSVTTSAIERGTMAMSSPAAMESVALSPLSPVQQWRASSVTAVQRAWAGAKGHVTYLGTSRWQFSAL